MTYETGLQVTDDASRKAARKLLRDKGLPTSEVHRMSYAALTAALQVQNVDPEAFKDMKAAYAQGKGPDVPQNGQGGAQGEGTGEGEGSEGEGKGEPKDGGKDGDKPAKDGQGKGKGKGEDDSLTAKVREICRQEIEGAEVATDEVGKLIDAAIAARVPQTIKVECAEIVREVEGAVHYMFPHVMKALAAKCHVWLPGPAGSGKSTLGRQCGYALGYSDPVPGEDAMTTKRIHMTGAIETPYQLTGYISPSGDKSTLFTAFRKAWESGGLFIFDDTDRSNAKALAAFNEALANGHCAFPDGVIKAHPDFLCIATANTFGLGGGADYVGAGRLDKATLDRFVFLEIPYDEKCERIIAGPDGAEWCTFVQKVRAACHKLGLKHLVTPRATYKGLRLIAAGMDRKHVESATVYAGLDAETLSRVKGAL